MPETKRLSAVTCCFSFFQFYFLPQVFSSKLRCFFLSCGSAESKWVFKWFLDSYWSFLLHSFVIKKCLLKYKGTESSKETPHAHIGEYVIFFCSLLLLSAIRYTRALGILNMLATFCLSQSLNSGWWLGLVELNFILLGLDCPQVSDSGHF